MSTKSLIWIGLMVGSTAGGFFPGLFGMDLLSYDGMMWGIVGSVIGGILGIIGAYKLSNL